MKMRKLFTTIMAMAMLLTLLSGMTVLGVSKGDNVLLNSDFEQQKYEEVEIWTTVNGKGTVYMETDAKYVRSGQYSMALVGENAVVQQAISVQGGVEHWAECWGYPLGSTVDTDNGAVRSWYQMQIQYFDEPLHNGAVQGNSIGGVVQIKNTTLTNEEWALLSATYTPPENAQSAIFSVKTRSSMCNLRIDDVKTGPYTDLDEVVSNGKFEDDTVDSGAPAGWTGFSHGSYPGSTVVVTNADAHSGAKSMKINNASMAALASNHLVPCKPNTDYVFSFWYKSTAAIPCVSADFRDSSGSADATATNLAETRIKKSAYTSSNWEFYSTHVRSGEKTAQVNIMLRCRTANGSVLFDDVSLKEDKTSVSFTDTAAQANPVKTFVPGESVKVNYHHVAKKNGENVNFCIALYKKAGTTTMLESVQILKETVNLGTPWDTSYTVTAPSEAGEYTLKAFAWDGTTGLTPLGIKHVIRSTTPTEN